MRLCQNSIHATIDPDFRKAISSTVCTQQDNELFHFVCRRDVFIYLQYLLGTGNFVLTT
jgi:hypothetical protein